MSDPKRIPITLGMARRLQAAKRQAEQRDRLISYMAARGIHQIEAHLKEAAR